MVKFVRNTLALLALALVAGAALADPSGRVGRISYLYGQVDFRSTYDDEAAAAVLNWPLTSQNVMTTAPGARAELRVGSTAIRIDADSELEIAQLDDDHLRLRLMHGSANVRVRNRDLADDFELRTPQGLVLLSGPALFRIDAERAPDTTTVGVFSGAIRFDNDGNSLTVPAGRQLEFAAGNMRVGGLQRDAFDDWALARDQREEQSPSLRYVSPETTGYEELDNYGSWQASSDYGPVWYPNTVPAGWTPYQSGRWTWVEPWGWTWVDNAPWGYAPTHYGRWAFVGNRWCWAPGSVTARPVWAPALVGWVGGSNWRVSFSGGAAPAVGWFPLAPREVFVPSYSVSPTYVRRVNISHVTNINTITNVTNFTNVNGGAHPPQVHYQNRDVRDAVTVVPHAEFERGRRSVPVTPIPARLIDPRQLQQAPTSAIAALPRDQHFQPRANLRTPDPVLVPRERRYGQQPPLQPQLLQPQQPQAVQPSPMQRSQTPTQQLPPPVAPTTPSNWRAQPRQEPSQGNSEPIHPQQRAVQPAPAAAPGQVQAPLQPRPGPSSPTPGWRERAPDRAERGTPDENRSHRPERPMAPQQPQLQNRVEPARQAPPPAAVAAPVAVPLSPTPGWRERAPDRAERGTPDENRGRRPERPMAPQQPQLQNRVEPARQAPPPAAVAAPVAVPQPVRIENRVAPESRQRQRDSNSKDDEHGRRPERGDPRNQLQ
ncbi:DUF6600 domain-containing protein [Undibacterium arcticum]|uniref:DUF6600 domain-containing protein n=1 Tax=Undibacterium arcticum TaxID=1762892 RepID=UPI00361C5879